LLIPAFALFYLGGLFITALAISLLQQSLLLCASGIVLLAIRYGVRKNAVEVGMKLTQALAASARRWVL